MNPQPSILGLQLKRLGDVLLTTPAMELLGQAYPGADLRLAVAPQLAGLDALVPCCKIVPAPSGVAQYAALRHARFDWVLDFSGQDRCLLLAGIARAARKATFRKYWKKPLRRLVFRDAVKSSLRGRHVAEHLADLARHVGAHGEAGPPCLQIPPAAQQAAGQRRASAGLGASYALIHPGTARIEKFWSAEGWAAVADFLALEAGIPTLLTSSGSNQESAHLAAIRGAVTSPVAVLDGGLELGELFCLIRDAALFCGVDSAPLHVAEAFGNPSFTVFGPTDPAEWGPRHSPHLSLTPGQRLACGTSLGQAITPARGVRELRAFLRQIGLGGD